MGQWLEEVFVLNTVDMRAVSSYVNEHNSLEKEIVRKRDSLSCKALDQASFGLKHLRGRSGFGQGEGHFLHCHGGRRDNRAGKTGRIVNSATGR